MRMSTWWGRRVALGASLCFAVACGEGAESSNKQGIDPSLPGETGFSPSNPNNAGNPGGSSSTGGTSDGSSGDPSTPDGGGPSVPVDPSDPGDPSTAPGCDTPSASCDNHHTFTRTAPGAKAVQVAGDFTSWGTSPVALMNDGSGTWSASVELTPGVEHEYKFIVDGTWDGGENQKVTVCADAAASSSCAVAICERPKGIFNWEDAVMYFAVTDRMANSDGSPRSQIGSDVGPASSHFEGGDFKGVSSKLGYLTDLGVTALWLAAPYRQQQGSNLDPASGKQYTAFHGYWPSPMNMSFDADGNPTGGEPQVDSRWGSAEDLRALVDQSHAAESVNGFGVRVLFDYVMKHVSGDSPLYSSRKDLFIQNAEDCRGPDLSTTSDDLWSHPEKRYTCKFPGDLPPFDLHKAEARHWTVSDALWWATEFDLDGYRLDAIKHVPPEWLTELRSTQERQIPKPAGGRFYLVGETYSYDPGEIKPFVEPGTKLDGQFDFPLRMEICKSVFRGESLAGLRTFMDRNDTFYGPGSLMSTFVGNHDLVRAVHYADRTDDRLDCGGLKGDFPNAGFQPTAFGQSTESEPYERLALSFAVLFTNPGVPMLYYGDEVGLAGGGDPDNRRFMPADTELNPAQLELRRKVRALARARAENPVLSRGLRETLTQPTATTWVYRKFAGCEGFADVVVALNSGDTEASVSIPAGSYDNLIDPGPVAGGAVKLPARGFVVLRKQ